MYFANIGFVVFFITSALFMLVIVVEFFELLSDFIKVFYIFLSYMAIISLNYL
jgi:hypothetical protein